MKQNTKKMKIILYTLTIILVLTVGVCSYLVVTDIIKTKQHQELLEKNTVYFKEIPKECVIQTNDITEIKPLSNCQITDYTVNNYEIDNKKVTLNITYNKKDDKTITYITIGGKKIISSILDTDNSKQDTIRLQALNDKMIYASSNTLDQIGTSDIVIFNSDGEILVEAQAVLLTKKDDIVELHKYNFADIGICDNKEYENKIADVVTKYKTEDNKLTKLYTDNITCKNMTGME